MFLLSFLVSSAILAELSLPPLACSICWARVKSLSLRTLFLILPTWRAAPAVVLVPPAALMASLKPPALVSAFSAVWRAALMMARSASETEARLFSSICLR